MEVTTQVEKLVKLENVDLLSLLGFNDINLKTLEDRFNAVITVRGDIVYLKGISEEVNLVEKIIKEMVFVLNTSGKLKPEDAFDYISNHNISAVSIGMVTKDEAIQSTKIALEKIR